MPRMETSRVRILGGHPLDEPCRFSNLHAYHRYGNYRRARDGGLSMEPLDKLGLNGIRPLSIGQN
jgi:hypothetical protein